MPNCTSGGCADSHLTADEFQTILAHELSRVRRRDNLWSALHMMVEAAFRFHPLVWWLGKRLVEERERACDEAVLAMGGRPDVYAESILKVCRLYLQSPVTCAAGVTGSDLKKRIAEIVANRFHPNLSLTKRALLAMGIAVILAVPIGVGVLRAQQQAFVAQKATNRSFSVATIKPSRPDVDGSGCAVHLGNSRPQTRRFKA